MIMIYGDGDDYDDDDGDGQVSRKGYEE